MKYLFKEYFYRLVITSSGIGNATVYGNGLVIIGRYFRKRRSLATSLAVAGGSVGQFALPPFIEFLLERFRVEGALLVIGALYLHTAIAGMLFRLEENFILLVLYSLFKNIIFTLTHSRS